MSKLKEWLQDLEDHDISAFPEYSEDYDALEDIQLQFGDIFVSEVE